MVGTPMKTVMGSADPWWPVRRRVHRPDGLNLGMNSTAAPEKWAHIQALTMPWMWCSGSGCRIRSEGAHSQAAARLPHCASRLACVCSAPFGRPVVPEV